MGIIIELHDSWVAGITTSGGSVLVRYYPAYVHCSEGRAGFDPGSVWVQDIDLVVSEAVLESSFTEMPRELDDGSLSVGNEVFENAISFPLDVRGAVRFSVVSRNGERLVIQGTRATVVPVGKGRYVEQFPGTK
jgi:hypothetical protein